MKKFAYKVSPNGETFFIKAKTKEIAREQLLTTFGKVHSITETKYKTSVSKGMSMFEFELSLLN